MGYLNPSPGRFLAKHTGASGDHVDSRSPNHYVRDPVTIEVILIHLVVGQAWTCLLRAESRSFRPSSDKCKAWRGSSDVRAMQGSLFNSRFADLAHLFWPRSWTDFTAFVRRFNV